MAIKNASDLLVYAKTASAAKQVTRIRILSTDPITIEDGESLGRLLVNNTTSAAGGVYDGLVTGLAANSGSSVMTQIASTLTSVTQGYTDLNSGSNQTDGDYIYRDFENGAVGLVPTIEIADGTAPNAIATINENGIIVEIVTPGSSAIFDPVAFSTSASFSTNIDLRDVTNKDSNGWSESLGGLRSFEISTDLLQSINPDTPLDGTDFFDKLKNRSLVNLSFSDRIRNIIPTNVVQANIDEFALNSVNQQGNYTDPFGGTTASRIVSTTSDWDRLEYKVAASRVENKTLTWSFYVKGSDSTTCSFLIMSSSSDTAFGLAQNIGYKEEILSGQGTFGSLGGSNTRKITGLSTGDFTRVAISITLPISIPNGDDYLVFNLYPGEANAQSSDSIVTSNWQIELTSSATDYQDPIDITHWQGNALVSSLSYDAGVEDNLTCSATFTGTDNVYLNGLGPELLGDTEFNDASYWTISNTTGSSSVVEDGYGKIITDGAATYIKSPTIFTIGDFYLFEYTIHTNTVGALVISRGWEHDPDVDMRIPSTVGTHKVLLKPEYDSLYIKRNGEATIWLSSASVKKVL